MKKIKICEEDTSLRELLSLCLQLKDYEAVTISGMSSFDCPCQSDEECATALIVSTKCPDACKALLDEQEKNGCRIPRQNKVILSAEFTEEQREKIEKAGYATIVKPYKFADISGWLDSLSWTRKKVPENQSVEEESLKDSLGGFELT